MYKYFKDFKHFLPRERTLHATDHHHLWPMFGTPNSRTGRNTGQYKTRTADYGLGLRTGYKTRTGHKTRTKHYGLGIKYGLRYKTRTEHYGLSMNHEERFYIE